MSDEGEPEHTHIWHVAEGHRIEAETPHQETWLNLHNLFSEIYFLLYITGLSDF